MKITADRCDIWTGTQFQTIDQMQGATTLNQEQGTLILGFGLEIANIL